MSKTNTLSADLRATILEGHEWGISYGDPASQSGDYASKFVTTDVAGPAGFALAAAAGAALDTTKPVRAVQYKGPKKLAIATMVALASLPKGQTEQRDIALPHARNLSLTP